MRLLRGLRRAVGRALIVLDEQLDRRAVELGDGHLGGVLQRGAGPPALPAAVSGRIRATRTLPGFARDARRGGGGGSVAAQRARPGRCCRRRGAGPSGRGGEAPQEARAAVRHRRDRARLRSRIATSSAAAPARAGPILPASERRSALCAQTVRPKLNDLCTFAKPEPCHGAGDGNQRMSTGETRRPRAARGGGAPSALHRVRHAGRGDAAGAGPARRGDADRQSRRRVPARARRRWPPPTPSWPRTRGSPRRCSPITASPRRSSPITSTMPRRCGPKVLARLRGRRGAGAGLGCRHAAGLRPRLQAGRAAAAAGCRSTPCPAPRPCWRRWSSPACRRTASSSRASCRPSRAARRERLAALSAVPGTLVFFESPAPRRRDAGRRRRRAGRPAGRRRARTHQVLRDRAPRHAADAGGGLCRRARRPRARSSCWSARPAPGAAGRRRRCRARRGAAPAARHAVGEGRRRRGRRRRPGLPRKRVYARAVAIVRERVSARRAPASGARRCGGAAAGRDRSRPLLLRVRATRSLRATTRGRAARSTSWSVRGATRRLRRGEGARRPGCRGSGPSAPEKQRRIARAVAPLGRPQSLGGLAARCAATR